MILIDPFQFHALFADARSFAVIGNAPTILEYEHGSRIDSYDVIVRFNRATTANLESRIGSRTDILVVNAANSRRLGPPPSETVLPRCLVAYLSPEVVPIVDHPAFEDWVGRIPILLGFAPDPFGLPAEYRTRALTSGTYFLLTLLRMFKVESLFVTGFTMFGAVQGGSAKYYRDDRPSVGSYHDLDVESRLFASLFADFQGALALTPEVSQLVRKAATSAGLAQQGSRLRKRLAEGLAWRVLKLGIRLRRISERA